MILLRAEQDALADWVVDLSQDEFDVFLGRTLQCRMHHFSSKHSSMPVVAVAFLEWLENNSPRITTLLTAVLGEFPEHPSSPTLRAALQRLSHAEARASATTFPWDAVLIRGIPIVNRAPLRGALADLVNGGWRSVILVAGPQRSGRTHSWHLIDHVAESAPAILCIKADLNCGTLTQKPIEEVFRFLMEKLHLRAELPTTVGTTVATIAERYASSVATALSAVHPRRRVWIVFDGVDRPTTPEVKAFVCTLAEYCLSRELRDCAIFLLGADRDLSIEDIHRRAQMESLSIFLPQEITDTAKALNALGRKPLSDAELATRVHEMLALSRRHPEPRMWDAIADKLVDLRIEVDA